MFTNHDAFPQDHSGEYLLLTLKELKNMVENTAGRCCPTPKYLREYETLLVRKEMDSCCLEVYMCGFAIYQTAHHYAVLRIEETGQPEYHSVTERDGCGVNTENMDWSIDVMLCGEDRIEAEVMDKASDRLISMTQTGSYENDGNTERREMEFEASTDIEGSYIQADIMASLLANLSERQKRIFDMYYFQGLTHQRIADVLGVKRPTISKCLKSIICKAEKIFWEEGTK